MSRMSKVRRTQQRRWSVGGCVCVISNALAERKQCTHMSVVSSYDSFSVYMCAASPMCGTLLVSLSASECEIEWRYIYKGKASQGLMPGSHMVPQPAAH